MTSAGQLPRPRGRLTEALFRRLRSGEPVDLALPDDDADLQLALWCLYSLHYRGFVDVDDRLEWAPDVIGLRGRLEEQFEDELRALAGPAGEPQGVASLIGALQDLVTTEEQQRPALASYLGGEATREEFVDFVMLRSVSHLQESDPQAFVVPRLGPGPKAALAELQYDEYGGGRPDHVHAQLFADAMAALGLGTEPGGYLDRVPATVLAESNAMSMFALNRRLRGAALGHLAAFESTSTVPCRFIAAGARRLGLPEEVARYYDEHVEADAVHEQVAIREICGRLVEEEPEMAPDVLLGARVCLALAERVGATVLEAWRAGGSPLLPDPIGAAA